MEIVSKIRWGTAAVMGLFVLSNAPLEYFPDFLIKEVRFDPWDESGKPFDVKNTQDMENREYKTYFKGVSPNGNKFQVNEVVLDYFPFISNDTVRVYTSYKVNGDVIETPHGRWLEYPSDRFDNTVPRKMIIDDGNVKMFVSLYQYARLKVNGARYLVNPNYWDKVQEWGGYSTDVYYDFYGQPDDIDKRLRYVF